MLRENIVALIFCFINMNFSRYYYGSYVNCYPYFQSKPTEATETQASILPSCPDLFVFYKKSLIQCAQLDKGKTMLGLTNVFRKYLELYAEKLLQVDTPLVSKIHLKLIRNRSE